MPTVSIDVRTHSWPMRVPTSVRASSASLTMQCDRLEVEFSGSSKNDLSCLMTRASARRRKAVHHPMAHRSSE